jgi:hypothetical protein
MERLNRAGANTISAHRTAFRKCLLTGARLACMQARTEGKSGEEEEEDAGKLDMRTRVKIQELKEHGTELYKKQKFEEAIK